MMSKKAIRTKFLKKESNQQILANYWGNGKTFTADDLRNDLDIASPGARLTELREAGFNVKATADNSGYVGRPAVVYSIQEEE